MFCQSKKWTKMYVKIVTIMHTNNNTIEYPNKSTLMWYKIVKLIITDLKYNYIFPTELLVCAQTSWGVFSNSVSLVLQTCQMWVRLCGATSPGPSSWRASARRSPSCCRTPEPETGASLCCSQSWTGPPLSSDSPATASPTPRWRRYGWKNSLQTLRAA